MPSGPAVGEPLTPRAPWTRRSPTSRAVSGPGRPSAGSGAAGAVRAHRRARPRAALCELLTGELRQGALEGLVVEAIAQRGVAAARGGASARRCTPASVGELARAALEEGAAGLSRFSLRLLSPVAPMLASPAGDAEEAIERLGEAAFEYKVDGARLQVHRAGDEVRVFTRQLQDVTARVPEVVEWARALPVREAVRRGRGDRPARRTAGPGRSRRRCAGSAAAGRRDRPRRSCRCRRSSSTCCTSRATGRWSRCRTPSASSACSGSSHPTACCPRLVTARSGRGGPLLRRGARGRPRGADGEVARRRRTRRASAASTG